MIRVLVSAVFLFALMAPTKAATIEVSQVIDATRLDNGLSPGGLYTGAPFVVAVGDTLVVNFSFLPGQALSVLNPGIIGMNAEASDFGTPSQTSISLDQQNSLAFVGLQGNAHDVPFQIANGAGYAIGSFFFASDFLDGTSGTLTFTGLRFGITVLSYSNGITEREYSALDLFVGGDSTSVVAVPEPSQGMLLLAGLAVTAYALRRRLNR